MRMKNAADKKVKNSGVPNVRIYLMQLEIKKMW